MNIKVMENALVHVHMNTYHNIMLVHYAQRTRYTCIKWVGAVMIATAYALRSRALSVCRNCSRVGEGEGEGESALPSSSHRGEPRDCRAMRSTFLCREK